MSHIKERTCQGRRTLRPRKNVMNCPLCSTDIAEFLQNLEVNTDLANAILEMQQKLKDLEEEKGDEEKVEAQESQEIDIAGKETVDEAKESISPAPETETTPQQACEEKSTRKRKTSNNAENVVDDGAVRNKKGKMAAAVAV